MSELSPIIPQIPSRGRGWDWAAHKRHGKVGGEDFEVPSGTPILADAAGAITVTGTIVRLTIDTRRSIIYRHVYPHRAVHGRRVAIGDVIALSGADGGLWPHKEAYLDGKRIPFSTLVAQYRKARAAADKKAAAASSKNYVRAIAGYLNRRKLGRTTAASKNGIRGPIYWWLIQKAGKLDGLYGRGWRVNGIPGKKTKALEAVYARKVKAK